MWCRWRDTLTVKEYAHTTAHESGESKNTRVCLHGSFVSGTRMLYWYTGQKRALGTVYEEEDGTRGQRVRCFGCSHSSQPAAAAESNFFHAHAATLYQHLLCANHSSSMYGHHNAHEARSPTGKKNWQISRCLGANSCQLTKQ